MAFSVFFMCACLRWCSSQTYSGAVCVFVKGSKGLLIDSDLVCVFWELGGGFERGKCAAI